MVHQQKKIKYDEFKNSGVITLFRDKELTMKGRGERQGVGGNVFIGLSVLFGFLFLSNELRMVKSYFECFCDLARFKAVYF